MRPDASENSQISPSTIVRAARAAGSHPHLASVLLQGRKSANIYASSGVIRGIPGLYHRGAAETVAATWSRNTGFLEVAERGYPSAVNGKCGVDFFQNRPHFSASWLHRYNWHRPPEVTEFPRLTKARFPQPKHPHGTDFQYFTSASTLVIKEKRLTEPSKEIPVVVVRLKTPTANHLFRQPINNTMFGCLHCQCAKSEKEGVGNAFDHFRVHG
jgi:hypothetical protein